VYNRIWGESRLTLTELTSTSIGYTVLFFIEFGLILIPFAWFLFSEKTHIRDFIKGTNAERKDLKYWAFSICILLTLIFYSNPKSLPRYALPILPLYWVFAIVWDRNNKIGKVLFVLLTMILIIGTILFATNQWFL
jgi:hypothetical protein